MENSADQEAGNSLSAAFARQFLIGHNVISPQSVTRLNEVMSQMVPFRSIGFQP
jgi:hypothetical protein